MFLSLYYMFVICRSESTSVLKRRCESMMVFRLTVDAASRSTDVVEMAFEVRTRGIDSGEVVV